MGFFARLFGKRGNASDHEASVSTESGDSGYVESVSDDPPELVPAIEALQSGDYETAIAHASPFLGDQNRSVRADALRLLGIAYGHQERYQEALPFWEKLVEVESSGHNWAQLAATAAAVGRLEISEPAFEKAIELSAETPEGRPSPIPMLHGNYASALNRGGHPQLALRHLDILESWYRSLGITDSMFLYMRGMPFFEVFLQNAIPIVRKVKSPTEVASWLQELGEAVDEDGQAVIADHLAGIGGAA